MKTKDHTKQKVHKVKAPGFQELKTEPPISEKDEVKQAEERTIQTAKKQL